MTNGEQETRVPGSAPPATCAPTTSVSAGEVDSAKRLPRLAAIAEELGAGRVADGARELAARTAGGRFYVTCEGRFKRGKSTLVNAPIGAARAMPRV